MIVIAISSFLFYIYTIEPQWIDFKNIDLNLPNLSKEFEGWKIVQVSDIHISEWMTEKRLENIVQLINEQNPDIVVLTGDFFSQRITYTKRFGENNLPYVEKHPSFFKKIMNKTGIYTSNFKERSLDEDRIILTNALSKLNPTYKSFSVLGNHDYGTNFSLVETALKDSNIINLKNDVYTIEKNNSILNIAGVDDILFRKYNLDLVLEKLPKTGINILLAHEPDLAFESAITHRFALQLSGHSHGGQVNIPFFGAPFLPPYGEIYISGLYHLEDMIQYTNRGIGMAYPYIRFNCRPEITIFTLHSP
ncbi:MAG: metallophosphoesterase [Cyanobacteria bacterium]|nr:metallophosphoesterase [Cyanobacteria bacterium CG_2015-16_32_12]NCO79597.1 metallophosphoesterase [Cyanobacteria bacterium CG_2015-22_32_23]NCQ03200.1 metallophosphoesterase [Cyanobacteria bacterium CG_2015-09_32_10]NCQ43148.1 metallophosphoesterase [Cyanobacteria bacterium CG_2015-04_32_10]